MQQNITRHTSASAMAIPASVTVSMGELTTGQPSLMRLVS